MPDANLIRCVPTGGESARIRVGGKLIRRSLKTDGLSLAKQRLADFEKPQRIWAANESAVSAGKMTLREALKTEAVALAESIQS